MGVVGEEVVDTRGVVILWTVRWTVWRLWALSWEKRTAMTCTEHSILIHIKFSYFYEANFQLRV